MNEASTPGATAFARRLIAMKKGRKRPSRTIVDRSVKAHSSLVPKSSDDARARAKVALIENGIAQANIENVLRSIETMIFYFRDSYKRDRAHPRASEHRIELSELMIRAIYLLEALECLSERSRAAILDFGMDAPDYFEIGPDELNKTLQKFMVRLIGAEKRILKDIGGARRHDDLRQLLLGLSLIWHDSNPADKGVRLVKSEVMGPLLDFVEKLLMIFAVRTGNGKELKRDTLGRLLFEMRGRAIDIANSERNRNVTATKKGSVTTVTKW